ncbi:MAG: 50S ribosomal protein L11 methyltransferase [Myxococcota bacterium]
MTTSWRVRIAGFEEEGLGRLDAWLRGFGLEAELEADPLALVAHGPEAAARAAAAAVPEGLEVQVDAIAAADWGAAGPAGARWFGPLRVQVSRRVDLEPSPPETGLVIDPQQTFGTGLHPSTALLIEAIVAARPDEILDVGTGSGILALAALRLGATRAVGVDISDDILEVARANAESHRLPLVLRRTLPQDQFRFVAANILPAELVELAPEVIRCLSPQATLWVSGLREDQAPEVIAAYRGLGLKPFGRPSLAPNSGSDVPHWCALAFLAAW